MRWDWAAQFSNQFSTWHSWIDSLTILEAILKIAWNIFARSRPKKAYGKRYLNFHSVEKKKTVKAVNIEPAKCKSYLPYPWGLRWTQGVGDRWSKTSWRGEGGPTFRIQKLANKKRFVINCNFNVKTPIMNISVFHTLNPLTYMQTYTPTVWPLSIIKRKSKP